MLTAWTGSFRQSRLPLAHHIEVPDYADADLARISEAMLAAQGYGFDTGARTAMAEYIALRRAQPHFANAQSMPRRCRP